MTCWEELQAEIRKLPGRRMMENRMNLEYMLFWAQVHGIDKEPEKFGEAMRGFTGNLAATMIRGAWVQRIRLAEQGFAKPCLPEGTDLDELREKAMKGRCYNYWFA